MIHRFSSVFSTGLLLVLLAGSPVALASDRDLIGIIVNGAGIEKYLESEVPENVTESGKLAVKTVEAFGTKFSGQTVFKGGQMRSVYLTPEDSKMSPEVAAKAFNDIGKSLSEKLGEPYQINNVPNFEDGSEPRKDYRLWMVGKDVVVLNLTAYSKRAGVYLQRTSRAKWQADMGADIGQYWEAKLKELGVPQMPANGH